MSRQKVQVFAIGLPKAGTPKEKRRFYVRWRIDGSDKMRALKTKGEAERLCSRLQHALLSGQQFDPSTGMPEEWNNSDETWWTWSQEWLRLKWPQWSGNSRRSSVESLMANTPYMIRRGAPNSSDDFSQWLREEGFAVKAERTLGGEVVGAKLGGPRPTPAGDDRRSPDRRQTGTIFQNLATHTHVGQQNNGVLLPLQPDEIANTLAATTAPAARLTVALAAIHAAGTQAIRDLIVDDIDIGNRRLVIAGRVRPLDDLTRQQSRSGSTTDEPDGRTQQTATSSSTNRPPSRQGRSAGCR